ncbi:hypothetical protein SCARD494_02734 [Seiridium cardinale]
MREDTEKVPETSQHGTEGKFFAAPRGDAGQLQEKSQPMQNDCKSQIDQALKYNWAMNRHFPFVEFMTECLLINRRAVANHTYTRDGPLMSLPLRRDLLCSYENGTWANRARWLYIGSSWISFVQRGAYWVSNDSAL